MVKLTAPKRTKKSVTADTFWSQKNKGKKIEDDKPIGKNEFVERRYHFVRPTEKLEKLDVNVAHYIKEINILPYSHSTDNIGSFFFDELENFKFLDLTDEYQDFYGEVYDITLNLPLILHNLEKIVDILVRYLDADQCRKSILRIMPALLRDTQKEIYLLFCDKILPKLVDILNERNPDILEDLFKCIAYGLKYLLDEIKANFRPFYHKYVENFFSSTNKYIQRFTTESLSYVLRKLKTNEIKDFISIVLEPLHVDMEEESTKELISNHVAKLMFYTIKHSKETFFSKSLNYVESIAKYIFAKEENKFVEQFLVSFVKEVLRYSSSQYDPVLDEFQEKIFISKPQLFEHFAKIFISWLSDIENVKLVIGKIALISEAFTQMLVYRKGEVVTPGLLKVVFKIIKMLETVSSNLEDKESSDKLKLCWLTILAKVLKYKEKDIYQENEIIQFIQLKVKGVKHSEKMINVLFQNIIEESPENIPHSDYLLKEDFLDEIYSVQRLTYDTMLNLVLENFNWEDITLGSYEEKKLQYLNFYLFSVVHKYSNANNKIKVHSDNFSISEASFKSIEQTINNLLEGKNFVENFMRVLLFIKLVSIFDLQKKEHFGIYQLLENSNKAIEKYLFEGKNYKQKYYLNTENMYKLPAEFLEEYNHEELSRGTIRKGKKDLLLILKGEILASLPNFYKKEEGNYQRITEIITHEFKILLLAKYHVYYLRSFYNFINSSLEVVKSISNKGKDSNLPNQYFAKKDTILLNKDVFGEYLNLLAFNLSNSTPGIRRYTLEILAKISAYHYPAPKDGQQTILIGECNAIELFLESERLQLTFENERGRTIFYTQIRVYSEQNKLPEEYALVALNCYIGTFFVKLSTVWECGKDNLVALLNSNLANSVYENLRQHFLYLNYILYKKKTDEPELEIEDGEDLSLLHSTDFGENKRSLLDAIYDDYAINCDTVNIQDVYKSFTEALSKATRVIERNSTDFYNLFTKFINQEYYNYFENKNIPIELDQIQDEVKGKTSDSELIALFSNNLAVANAEKDSDFTHFRYVSNLKLDTYLKIFLNFAKIREMKNSKEFYDLLLIFVRKGHMGIQKNALECIIKYDDEEIMKFADRLRKFLKKESYKDQILEFKLDPESKTLTFVERKTIVPIIISILFPKLFESRGSKHKRSHLDATRTIVYNFFSSLEPAEIDYLMAIVFRNHSLPYKNIENLSQEAIMNLISKIHIEKIIAFLISLENIIDQLGSILRPYLQTVFKILCSCVQMAHLFRNSNRSIIQEHKDLEEQDLKDLNEKEISLRLAGKFKKISQLAMARITQVYNKFSSFDFPQSVTDSLVTVLSGTIKNLSVEVTASVPMVLKLFQVWSDYDAYIHYFYDFDIILSSIAEVYSQKKVQAKALETVNQIILNLCECSKQNMDEEREGNEETAQDQAIKILKMYVETLVANIKVYFDNRIKAQGKKWKPEVKITKILVALSECIENTKLADDILGLFDKIIESKNVNKAYHHKHKNNVHSNTIQKNITLVSNALKIFSNFFKHSQYQEKFYPRVLDLLANLVVAGPREDVVAMIESLQLDKFKLSPETIKLVKSMNAYSRLADREFNYNEIATATYKINTEYLSKCSVEDQELILTNYLFFLNEDEITTRMAATAGFKILFESILEQFTFGNLDHLHRKIKFIINTVLAACIRGLKLRKENAVKSHFEVIDMYIQFMHLYSQKGLKLEEYPHALYLELKFLQNKTDLAQDFFDNFFDVQNMKRIKALAILNKRLSIMQEQPENYTEHITEVSIKNILLPVLKFQIFSKYLQENVLKSRGANSESHLAHAKNLVNQSIETHSLCAKYLNWPHFFNVLKAHVSTLSKESQYEKIVIRLLCSNLNNLDAGLPNIIDIVSTEMAKNKNQVVTRGVMQKLLNYEKQRDKEIENELQVEETDETKKEMNGDHVPHEKIAEIETMNQNNQDKIDVEDVQNGEKELKESRLTHIVEQLRKKILHPLKKHMHDLSSEENKEKKIRVYTAVAIAKLISRFPANIFNIEYPRLIHNICESLKSIDYEIRQNTRDALAEIVQTMGPYFFHFVAKQLNLSLTNGYQKHVLSYTLFFLIKTLIESKEDEKILIQPGSLDYCLDDIMPIFIDEILGKVREEKEVEEIKKRIPEFKTSKAYDGFSLISNVIDFSRSFVYLVNYLKLQLEQYSSEPKKCRQIEELFRRVLEGLGRNPSFDIELYLIISYYLIDQSLDSMMIKETKEMNEFTFQEYNMSPEDLKKYDVQKNYMIQDGAAQGRSIFKIIQNAIQKNRFVVGRIVASFCLNGVLMGIKKNLIHPTSVDPKEMSIVKKFEPLVKLVINCIKSNDNTIITNCIRILNTIVSWPMPSLLKNFKKIVSGSLQVMQSLSMLDFDMIKACFKLVAHTIHLNANNQLTNHHIKMLIQYIDQFMFVSDNIGEVLDTLTALIQKKIVRPEVYDLMDKIIENMVINYSITIQRACKNTLLVFLVEYPMTDKIIKKYINLLIKNLEYENESGRSAVIETMAKIVEVLPREVIENYIDLIVYACLARIVNEDVLELKQSLKKIVSNVFEKIDEGKINQFIQTLLTWVQDSNVGIFQSGMEGISILMERKHKLDKHLKVIFSNINKILSFTVQRLDQYWKDLKDDIAREKEEAKIESKILKRLKSENDPRVRPDASKYYSLGYCLASTIMTISQNYTEQFANYLKKESKEFLSYFVALTSFPQEQLVIAIMNSFSQTLQSLGTDFAQVYNTADIVYEQFGKRLLTMFKFNFSTDDFNSNLNVVVWSIYEVVKNDQKEIYCIQMLGQVLKMLLKMLASANFNASKIKRIVTFYHKLLTSSQEDLRGELLQKYIEILIRIEHVKDMFLGDHDISQHVDECLDLVKKRSDQTEFIKNYSSLKLSFESRRFENKRKAKELAVTDPELAAKEKIAKNQRKKSKGKNGINPINNLKKVKGNVSI